MQRRTDLLPNSDEPICTPLREHFTNLELPQGNKYDYPVEKVRRKIPENKKNILSVPTGKYFKSKLVKDKSFSSSALPSITISSPSNFMRKSSPCQTLLSQSGSADIFYDTSDNFESKPRPGEGTVNLGYNSNSVNNLPIGKNQEIYRNRLHCKSENIGDNSEQFLSTEPWAYHNSKDSDKNLSTLHSAPASIERNPQLNFKLRKRKHECDQETVESNARHSKFKSSSPHKNSMSKSSLTRSYPNLSSVGMGGLRSIDTDLDDQDNYLFLPIPSKWDYYHRPRTSFLTLLAGGQR